MAITAAAAAAQSQQGASGGMSGGASTGGQSGSSKSKSSSSSHGSGGGSGGGRGGGGGGGGGNTNLNDMLSLTRGSSASPSVNSSKSQQPSPSVTISASNLSNSSHGNHLQNMSRSGKDSGGGKGGGGGGGGSASDLSEYLFNAYKSVCTNRISLLHLSRLKCFDERPEHIVPVWKPGPRDTAKRHGNDERAGRQFSQGEGLHVLRNTQVSIQYHPLKNPNIFVTHRFQLQRSVLVARGTITTGHGNYQVHQLDRRAEGFWYGRSGKQTSSDGI